MPSPMVNEQSTQQTAQRKQPAPQQGGPSMPLVQGPPMPPPAQPQGPFQPLPHPGSALTSRPIMPGLGKSGGYGGGGNMMGGSGQDPLAQILAMLGGQ